MPRYIAVNCTDLLLAELKKCLPLLVPLISPFHNFNYPAIHVQHKRSRYCSSTLNVMHSSRQSSASLPLDASHDSAFRQVSIIITTVSCNMRSLQGRCVFNQISGQKSGERPRNHRINNKTQ